MKSLIKRRRRRVLRRISFRKARKNYIFAKKKLVPTRVENTRTVRKTLLLKCFLNMILNQLLLYTNSKFAVIKKLKEVFRKIKKLKRVSPMVFINNFFNKAVLRIFLRNYRMGNKKLLVPVPMSVKRSRLNFFKKLLIDLRSRSEANFSEKFINEIDDFFQKRGATFTWKSDAYLISKQNRQLSKYGYRNKSYVKKNDYKKSKFYFI